jgi:hypothetical protein
MHLGLMCVPRMEMKMKLALHKKCSHCGVVNDVGRTLSGMNRVKNCIDVVCWSCHKPLYEPSPERSAV